MKNSAPLASFAALCALVSVFSSPAALAAEPWSVVLGNEARSDAAVKVALEDLTADGARLGLDFSVKNATNLPGGNLLVVGRAAVNSVTAALIENDTLDLKAPGDAEGYAIQTRSQDGRRIMAISGGSVIGDVYGLYWILDRIRVHRFMPDIDVVRTPAMKVRFAAAWGRHSRSGGTKEQMHRALRRSVNWVSGPAILDLVPWNSVPEESLNAKNREKARELSEYAHALHMKFFSFANEFTFHPSLIEEQDATLTPCDPKYWDALQEKFRMLLKALPELDGIELCNDDISGFWDEYRAYDVMHENPECDWSYEKRFRTFVQKVHEVVSGEFGKKYFHFTWGLTMHEQHYQPDVFREIFTGDVPTEDLYLIPKITSADRWWHQPYNPTFNQTPHETLVCFETMNYYEGGGAHIFPTFSGQYFQAGLQTFLMPEDNNVQGTALAAGVADRWDTRGAYGYVLYRLMWNPNEDMETIARDFCAIHFGPEAAEGMAALYLLSPAAYKYGLHIEPVSYGQYNSFIHMRVGTFPVEGYPSIDGGKEHLAFLRKIYLRCKPWKTETLNDLDHGFAVADSMVEQYKRVKPAITDNALALEMEERLNMTRLLIATNNGYVKTTFAFFDYMEQPTREHQAALAAAYAQLQRDREAFVNAPGFHYNLFGVDQILKNAQAALADVAIAKTNLEKAPTRAELDATVAAQQRRFVEVLESYANEAVHFAHVEAQIDGRDILNITSDTYRIDHLRWDGPEVKECRILTPLPEQPVTVIVRDLYSRPMHPFVLQQPTKENNYTVRIYLDDLPKSKDWMRFDLYYLPRTPESVGLELPWAP